MPGLDSQFSNFAKVNSALILGANNSAGDSEATLVIESRDKKDKFYYFHSAKTTANTFILGKWQESLESSRSFRFRIISNSAGGQDLIFKDNAGKQYTVQSGIALTGSNWRRGLGKGRLKIATVGTLEPDSAAAEQNQLVINNPLERKGTIGYLFELA